MLEEDGKIDMKYSNDGMTVCICIQEFLVQDYSFNVKARSYVGRGSPKNKIANKSCSMKRPYCKALE